MDNTKASPDNSECNTHSETSVVHKKEGQSPSFLFPKYIPSSLSIPPLQSHFESTIIANTHKTRKVSIMRLTAMRVGMESRSRFPFSTFRKAGNFSGLIAEKCCLLTLFRTSIICWCASHALPFKSTRFWPSPFLYALSFFFRVYLSSAISLRILSRFFLACASDTSDICRTTA